jgi:hypothetical protein
VSEDARLELCRCTAQRLAKALKPSPCFQEPLAAALVDLLRLISCGSAARAAVRSWIQAATYSSSCARALRIASSNWRSAVTCAGSGSSVGPGLLRECLESSMDAPKTRSKPQPNIGRAQREFTGHKKMALLPVRRFSRREERAAAWKPVPFQALQGGRNPPGFQAPLPGRARPRYRRLGRRQGLHPVHRRQERLRGVLRSAAPY